MPSLLFTVFYQQQSIKTTTDYYSITHPMLYLNRTGFVGESIF